MESLEAMSVLDYIVKTLPKEKKKNKEIYLPQFKPAFPYLVSKEILSKSKTKQKKEILSRPIQCKNPFNFEYTCGNLSRKSKRIFVKMSCEYIRHSLPIINYIFNEQRIV